MLSMCMQSCFFFSARLISNEQLTFERVPKLTRCGHRQLIVNTADSTGTATPAGRNTAVSARREKRMGLK